MATNQFQHAGTADLAAMRAEHRALEEGLRGAGIEVHVLEGAPDTPDAHFPNNWFSTHEDGKLVVYPMLAPSRRRERHIEAILGTVCEPYELINITAWEDEGQYLEGTGSLVLDRENRFAFAALSARTTQEAVDRWCRIMGYQPVMFHTASSVYHTNVLMAIGADLAVVCPSEIVGWEHVRDRLDSHSILEISAAQMRAFAGNMLFLEGCVAMSETAWGALNPLQQRVLEVFNPVIVPFSTIESVGGGSVRCAAAELVQPSFREPG